MLSKYSSNIANKHDIKIIGVNKLVPNKYVLHYTDLQLYLSLGMKLVGVHKILKFKQSDWLKKQINFDTDKKKKMLSVALKKIFFKLMNNSVYGKPMENLRKRVKVDQLIMLRTIKNM